MTAPAGADKGSMGSGSVERMRVGVVPLHRFAGQLFECVGMPADDADTMARCLVGAHLRGVDTHGVSCIPNYVLNLEEGRVRARPNIAIERRSPWALAVDGGNGMGHVVATRAMRAAIETCATVGIAVATVRHSTHLGAAGLYPLMAADRGYLGVAMVNASSTVAPWGSRRKLFGTNPIAVAAPAGRHPPFVLDLATSAAARRKIRLALELGQPIPDGWALDADGNPTTDPAKALAGATLPMAGAKGSGLAMLVEVLAGVLSGAGFAGGVGDLYSNHERPVDSGNFLLALDVAAFMPLAEFSARMETLIERVHSLDPAPGIEAVRVPGERAARLEAKRRRDGIPLTAATVAELRTLGDRLGVPFPG